MTGMSALARDSDQFLARVWLPLRPGQSIRCNPQGLVKTILLPTRDTDIHARHFAPAE